MKLWTVLLSETLFKRATTFRTSGGVVNGG